MVMTEKPLHVRVAEALGCKPMQGEYDWYCRCGSVEHSHGGILRYDTDWSATGPLIEKYDILVAPPARYGAVMKDQWQATKGGDGYIRLGIGPTPIIAVCNLILALAEAGKLEAA